MKITTTKMDLARQIAGPSLPAGAELSGLIIEAEDSRAPAALVLMPTGLYVSMTGGVVRSIDQRAVHLALAQAERGRKPKTLSERARARKRKLLAKNREKRWSD